MRAGTLSTWSTCSGKQHRLRKLFISEEKERTGHEAQGQPRRALHPQPGLSTPRCCFPWLLGHTSRPESL